MTRIDVMESWTTYDFLAWGACCSMTLTTLPGIVSLLELKDKVLGFHGIAFVVETNLTGYASEIFELSHRRRNFPTARFFPAVRFKRLFYRLDSDLRRIISVHREGFDFFAEALLELLGESGSLRIGVRRPGDGCIVGSGYMRRRRS